MYAVPAWPHIGAPALAQLLLQYPFPATIYYKHMTSFTHTDNYRCMRSLHGLMSTLVRISFTTFCIHVLEVCMQRMYMKAYYIYTHKPVCVLSLHDLVSTPICGGTFCTHGLPKMQQAFTYMCVHVYTHMNINTCTVCSLMPTVCWSMPFSTGRGLHR